MADENARRQAQHESDYDGAWKEAFHTHLSKFTMKYFPGEHAEIDWTFEPEWCDTELSQVLGHSGRRNWQVDLLVKVRLKSGEDRWILFHLEIQSSHEEDFPERVSMYNCGFRWIFKHRVVSLVVLADLRKDWKPDEDSFRLGNFESHLKFPVCKLVEKLENEWKDDHSLPVLLARAQIEALRTAGDPEGRYQAKWTLLRSLYDLGYNKQQIRELARLIDWMMHLRADLEERLNRELEEFEEEIKMPYVTSFERIGQVKGLLIPLTTICGDLPNETENRVYALPVDKLNELGKDLLKFKSLADLDEWLDQHAGAGIDE